MNQSLFERRPIALKRRVRFAYGDSLAAEDRIDGGVPVFGSNGIVGAHDRSITTAPTIVIGRKGSSGKIVWSDVSCFPIDTTFFIDRSQTREDMRWLFYALESLGLDKLNFDSAVPGLSRELAYSLPLWFPPLPEQHRIAAFLDASCAAIDAAVAAKRGQVETLEFLRKSTVESLFAGLAVASDERVKDVAMKITSGVTPDGGAAGYLDAGVPLLRSQNVHFDGLRLDDVAYISAETHASMRGSQLQSRDVLLNITGASIGRCSFVPDDFGEGNVNQHVCIIRPGPWINHQFLAAFLSSSGGQDQINSTFTGASRQGLSHSDLGLIRVPVPKMDVQSTVVAQIEAHDQAHRKLNRCLTAQITTLTAYRKSLIHECVTGQRRISDADLQRLGVHA